MTPKEPFLSISKEALNKLPVESFPGDITVIDTEEQAATAVVELEKEPIVGFDTETRPSFRKGVTYTVALVQISTRDKCFLFRINKTGLCDSLRSFIENPAVKKIGLSLKDDFFVLHKIHDFAPESFVELQSMVGDYGIADASLQKIYGIIFGRRISKSQRLTNWEAQELTPAQQHYASLDAWACLKIHDELTAGRFDPESSPYRIAAETATDNAAV